MGDDVPCGWSQKPLLRDEATQRACFRLQPDLLVDGADDRPQLILDTKWKLLGDGLPEVARDVPSDDLYQLYAYAQRYQSPDNVLLYPQPPGTPAKQRKSYTLDGDPTKRIRIEFINLNRNLLQTRAQFKQNLKAIVAPRFD